MKSAGPYSASVRAAERREFENSKRVPRCQHKFTSGRQCARQVEHDGGHSLTPVAPVFFVPSAQSVHIRTSKP